MGDMEGFGMEGQEVIEEAPQEFVEEVEVDDNPWGWVDEVGADPDKVKETYTKFTQKTQGLSAKEKEIERMRDELAPLNKLRDSLAEDPGLVEAIENYFASGGTPDDELKKLKGELDTVKTSLQVEKELAGVARWVKENDLPPFDEDELLNHAAENRILNLKAAYRDLNFEKIQDRKADALAEDIKRGKNAALPKSSRADTGGKGVYSEEDIAAMTDEEFKENFASIFNSFK